MARAFQCDRCKDFAAGDPAALVSIRAIGGLASDINDQQVCQQCRFDLLHAFRTVNRANDG